MRKIPTVFRRDPATPKFVTDEVTPGCEWVFAGEGVATRKYDGACCMVRGGELYKRRELKLSQGDPVGFELVERDETTGKRVGWMRVGDGPEDKWFVAGWDEYLAVEFGLPPDGTYELVGPKVQGNPEGVESHLLIPHAAAQVLDDCPREPEALRAYVKAAVFEGVVFHHPDGRMAKLKRRDIA